MAVFRMDGLDVYYEVHGDGETIVLLHNGFSCAMMWKGIYPRLVDAGYQVVLYDRRGYGRSDEGPEFVDFYRSEGFRAYSVTELAQLVKFLGLDSFHMVGQCEGGVVGADYALAYPHQVKTLTAASTFCYSTVRLEEFNREKFAPSFSELSAELREKYVVWHGAERAEFFYELCSSYGGCYGRGMFDLRSVLSSIQCPTLVMYPDRGHFFPVEQGVAFYRSLSRGELAVFPRCGHNIFEHYPEEFASQVLRFLKRCG